MNPTFLKIFALIEPTHIKCVIAGGAVVDFDQALDIDVFVLSQDWRTVLMVGNAIDGRRFTGSLMSLDDDIPYEGGHADDFYRLGSCHPSWSPKPIHITGFGGLSTGNSSVESLLETFDLSVHAWAYDEKGRIHGIPTSTRPCDPITVSHIRSTTAARLLKLSQRYHPAGHPVEVH